VPRSLRTEFLKSTAAVAKRRTCYCSMRAPEVGPRAHVMHSSVAVVLGCQATKATHLHPCTCAPTPQRSS
jgi:hypothetical protein